jgi:hypothetical protein
MADRIVGDADRANAIALLLQALAREVINGPTTLHLIEAPTPGTVKGLLVEVIGRIVAGRRGVPVSAVRGDAAEWRKTIIAQLMAGRSMLIFDNHSESETLNSAALASALTTLLWEDRVLGSNHVVRFPVRVTWALTANNTTVSSEMARRIVRSRIDARRDRCVYRHRTIVRLFWFGNHGGIQMSRLIDAS